MLTTKVSKKEKRDLEEIALNARKEKAEKMLYSGAVTRIVSPIEIYLVASQTKKDTFYKVQCFYSGKTYKCDCLDFERQIEINPRHKCKHIILVELAEESGYIQKKMHETDKSGDWRNDEYSY